MTYNFDEIIDRKGTNALNTDGFRGYIFHAGPEKEFPFADDEFIRMWVADMDFAVAPEIRQAVKDRVDRLILGYTKLFDSAYYDAFAGWCKAMYDWSFPRQHLATASGVVPAVYELLSILLKNDEKFLYHTPAYGMFRQAEKFTGRKALYTRLQRDGSGSFTVDFDDFARKAADPSVKLLIWCSPHNPTGRVWTAEELQKTADIIRRNDLWVISDEIHCDLLRTGVRHLPLAKVMDGYKKIVTCTAASKTFNIAGLMLSNILIPDRKLHAAFTARNINGLSVNPLSLAAAEAAYSRGGAWLKELRAYLDGNFRLLEETLHRELPKIPFTLPQATYLAWVDFSPYLDCTEDLPDFFARNAGVLLEGGDSLFVDNAAGFARLNLAMPRSLLAEGLNRITEAVKAYKPKK